MLIPFWRLTRCRKLPTRADGPIARKTMEAYFDAQYHATGDDNLSGRIGQCNRRPTDGHGLVTGLAPVNAETADGVTVNESLETNAPGVFPAGDIAGWPDRLSRDKVRVGHLVVAEGQGQVAAHNVFGRDQRFDHVPLFWTDQHDFSLANVGHAEQGDAANLADSLENRDFTVTYPRHGQDLAIAIVHQDLDGQRAERAFEHRIAALDAASQGEPASKRSPDHDSNTGSQCSAEACLRTRRCQ